jgi:hypothetical protein
MLGFHCSEQYPNFGSQDRRIAESQNRRIAESQKKANLSVSRCQMAAGNTTFELMHKTSAIQTGWIAGRTK